MVVEPLNSPGNRDTLPPFAQDIRMVDGPKRDAGTMAGLDRKARRVPPVRKKAGQREHTEVAHPLRQRAMDNMLFMAEEITMKVLNRTARLVRTAAVAVLGASACLIAPGAGAQSYPNKPIRVIVPFPAGGNADVVVRLVTTQTSQKLGQTIVVDNKPGASTIIGTEMLAKAAADGYTLGMITDSLAINPMLFSKLPYDSEKDFEMISQLVAVPLVLLAHPSLNVKTVPELVALAKARQGGLNYASIGDGSAHHILMEWFNALAGIRMSHIPYKGVAPALNDLVGGQVDLMFSGTATLEQYTKTGKLVALGVTSSRREASFPDMPTIAEQNLPRFEVTNLGFALGAPATTPREIIVRLNQEIAAALAVPALRGRLESLGTVATPSSLADARTIIARAISQWARIIKESGVKLNPA